MSQPPNVQHFNYRGGLTVASALAEILLGIAFPATIIYVGDSGPPRTQPISLAAIVLLSVVCLFFLLIPIRDGLVWVLRCINEKFVIDGQKVDHYDKYGRLAHTFNLSDISSVEYVQSIRGRYARAGQMVLLSQQSRYILNVGGASIRVYEQLAGCDCFIALVRRFTNRPIFGLDNVPPPGP